MLLIAHMGWEDFISLLSPNKNIKVKINTSYNEGLLIIVGHSAV